jgi:hypothetical protein
MDTADLLEYVDHQRWSMNNGLFTDAAKNQLFMYGSLIHKDVRSLELTIEPQNKTIRYVVYVDTKLLKLYNKYQKLLTKQNSIVGLILLRRFLRKHGDLNFHVILNNFVKDYCGAGWITDLKIDDFKNYTTAPNACMEESDVPEEKI